MSWLPQNDILGHSKVKLFFGHGGVSGLFESIYHGVPLVIAPFFGDQTSNANTAKQIGIADKVDLKSITADELVQVMRAVMTKARWVVEDPVSGMCLIFELFETNIVLLGLPLANIKINSKISNCEER